MSLKTFATLALATGFAAAKPISAPQSKRGNVFGQGFNGAVVNGFNGQGFNFADGFNKFNQQQQVIQVQEQNLQIIDNGFQQQVVEQVNQVLVVDQVNNGFRNDMNNIFRKSNFQNKFRDVATVMMVVQEIQVSVDNGRGGQFQQQVFAQSVVVANRGAQRTQSIMVLEVKTLIAQDILANNAFANIGQFGGVAGATGAFDKALPTKTQGIQLFGAKPTWEAVAEDPAAVLGGIWEGAIQDLQKNDNDAADNKLNEQLAAQEKQKLDELKQQGDQQAKDQQAKDQQAKDQQAKDQQAKDQQAKDQQAKDQAAQDNKDQAAQGNKDQQKQGNMDQAAQDNKAAQNAGQNKDQAAAAPDNKADKMSEMD